MQVVDSHYQTQGTLPPPPLVVTITHIRSICLVPPAGRLALAWGAAVARTRITVGRQSAHDTLVKIGGPVAVSYREYIHTCLDAAAPSPSHRARDTAASSFPFVVGARPRLSVAAWLGLHDMSILISCAVGVRSCCAPAPWPDAPGLCERARWGPRCHAMAGPQLLLHWEVGGVAHESVDSGLSGSSIR